MSEYTKYFIVKSSSEEEVKQQLHKAKIISIVDADTVDYWFNEKYKRNGTYNWVVVSAPATMKGPDGEYKYENQFEKLQQIFDTVIFFFQEEDGSQWFLNIKTADHVIFKEFEQDKNTLFTDLEKQVISTCFNHLFEILMPLLQPGKAHEFLNFVGIPYMEMNDQDLVPANSKFFDNSYSILANEFDD